MVFHAPFKALILTYTSLYSLGTTYLKENLTFYVYAALWPSEKSPLLVPPLLELRLVGAKAFSIVASNLSVEFLQGIAAWLRLWLFYRKSLKTKLFQKLFKCLCDFFYLTSCTLCFICL